MSCSLPLCSKCRKDLSDLREEKKKLVAERDAACGKVKELEPQVEGLEAKGKQNAKTISFLKSRNYELEDELKKEREERDNVSSDSRGRVAELEAELKLAREAKRKVDLTTADTAVMVLEMAGEGFEKALVQISLIHPSLTLDKEILDVEHDVVECRIFKNDPVSKERIMVYPPPSDI